MTILDDVRALSINLDVRIRVATKADIPRLEWYGQYTHFRNLFRKAYREQLQNRRMILVADCNNFPIANLFIQMKSANGRIANGESRFYLYSFRVMDMFQGKGIGTRLITTAEDLMRDRGFRFGTIAVAKDNLGALRLYERLGYKKFAEDPGRWSYVDHRGIVRKVEEPCWLLEKSVELR